MKRRMITDDIVSSGRFLRMSPSAQALYMHCVVNADDDGVVDMFSVFKMVGAKEDDVVLLVEREFVTPLDQTEYIFWISGFQDFNKIAPHIKEDSKYLPLLLSKVEGIEIVKSTKAEDNKRRYAQLKEQRKIVLQVKNYDPNRILQDHGHDPTTRLGKDRLGKTNIYSPKSSTSDERELKFHEKEQQLANKLNLLVGENYPFLKKKGNAARDYEAIEKLHRLDNREYDLIEQVIMWCQKDTFWRQNIRSCTTLRDKFDTILTRMVEQRKKQGGVYANR